MADHLLLSWDASEFTIISGANPFSDYNDPNTSSMGTIFTVGPGEVITVSDFGSEFDEFDLVQKFEGSSDPDGRNPPAGTDIDPEYTYTIRPVDGPSNGSQDVVIYVYEMGVGPGADGFVANAYVAPGQQYEIVAIDVVDRNVPYNNIYICFAAATNLLTDAGPRQAGALAPGDRVWTADSGFCPIRWVGRRHISGSALAEDMRLRPVRIAAGAIAPGIPRRDIVVSPQHRILLRSIIAERMFGHREILVPAHALADQPGITRITPAEGISYVHILLDAHQILDAEGMLTESLFLGPQTRKALGERQIRQIAEAWPKVIRKAESGDFDPARQLVQGNRLRSLLRRMGKNGKPLFDSSGDGGGVPHIRVA
ncbi:Hint domain-containing protein [Pseudooceanicola sp.]|uniref:Hint domain-containing protein n=1 Tax=Pseudooceanicola sp. TaxID=1914328 RepID=UPI0026148F50|nr:Hint domain-containing protein [Pseudooceanicola sp.]MDF1856543.1 Hint domain-containing protein [Pseudooceanicola sp.]